MSRAIIPFFVFLIGTVLDSLCHRKFFHLQILTIFSFLTVVLSCLVNFYVPIYAKRIVDSLTPTAKNTQLVFCWDLILILSTLKAFQGFGALSLITCLQQIMWLPVEQHIRLQIQTKFFQHVHSMSFNWMMDTKIGDILGALERGTESIVSTSDHLIYSVIPTLLDIVISLTYLSMQFGWILALTVGSQLVFYILFTVYITEKTASYQKFVNKSEDCLRQKSLESVLNYETVKCFGNEKFERYRYSSSLKDLQSQQYRIGMLTSLAQTVQHGIVCIGLLACVLLLLSSSLVDKKTQLTAGDYVLLTSYLAQLYGPLNYLAGYYSELRVNIVNAKSMMDYLGEIPEVRNSKQTCELQVEHGEIEFKDVCLVSSSGKQILQNISFVVAPQTTVALVGSTGSGKTSIAKLLMRLFDTTHGQILIDGTDVKSVTMESLRKSIGIIPQNISLFNDTIWNNIKYGKPDASEYEVKMAASLAQIHDTIMSFPNGYKTVVGERGTRLSGGEKQRIAICREILQQDHKILILDEATSALDATTESHLQEIFKQLCANRTCLMITHKLASTINADSIIVLENGRIVEQGSHDALLKKGGHFAAMWENQVQVGIKEQ